MFKNGLQQNWVRNTIEAHRRLITAGINRRRATSENWLRDIVTVVHETPNKINLKQKLGLLPLNAKQSNIPIACCEPSDVRIVDIHFLC